MKASAFGQRPQRRDVQPGGRVLPGTFASVASSPSPSTSSSAAPSPSTAVARANSGLANSSGALLSSWGTGNAGGSGRMGAASPSRLERIERARSSASEGLGVQASAPSAPRSSDSLSRARMLGLHRAAREPSPPVRSLERSPSPPARNRQRQPSPAPPPRRRSSPAATAPTAFNLPSSRSSSPAPTQAAAAANTTSATSAEPRGTLFGSLWNKASQVLGGTATGELGVVDESKRARPDSLLEPLGAPQSKITPFKLHEGDDDEGPAAGRDHQEAPKKEQSNLDNTRPIALPSLANRRRSEPLRSAVPALPPVEPISYHRPPPLHPRELLFKSARGRKVHRDPYDWLESLDESPLDAFLFHRQPGRAATRTARSARRPLMAASVTPDQGAARAPAMATFAAAPTAGVYHGTHGLPQGLFTTTFPPNSGQPSHPAPLPSFQPQHPSYPSPHGLSLPPPAPALPIYPHEPSVPPYPYGPLQPPTSTPAPLLPTSAARTATASLPPSATTFSHGPPPAPVAATPAPQSQAPTYAPPAPPQPPTQPAPPSARVLAPLGAQLEATLAHALLGPSQPSSAPSTFQQPGAAALPPSALQRPAPRPPLHPATGSGHTDRLPPMPTPLPIPTTSSPTQPAPGTSLYPAHLAALQASPVSPPVAAAAYAPPTWPVAAPGQSLYAVPSPHFASPPHFTPPPASSAALPGVAASRSPAIADAAFAQDTQSLLSANEDDEASDPNLPGYSSAAGSQVGIQSSPSSTPIPNSQFEPAPALSLPAFAALATPLPPSPAPSPIPPVVPTPSTEAVPSIQQPTAPTLPLIPLATLANPESLPSYEPLSLVDLPPPSASPPQLSISVSRTPSLAVSTNDSLLPAQFVFTPPTPISSDNSAINVDGTIWATYPARTAEDLVEDQGSEQEECEERGDAATEERASDHAEELEEEGDARSSPPAPRPLELTFSLPEVGLDLDLDLGFGDLTTAAAAPEPLIDTASYFSSLGYGASDLVGEVKVDGEGRLAYPERSSSPAAMFGAVEEEEEDGDDQADALSDAFDATTSFVNSFREADLARARQDPNHTERTERWLLQQGLTPTKGIEDFKALPSTNDEAVALDAKENNGQSIKSGSNGLLGPGVFRPRTAPPAAISPDLLSWSRRALSPSPLSSASPSDAPTHLHVRSASLNPSFLRTTLEPTEEGDIGSDGPPSPIETSIGVTARSLNRPRAVSASAGAELGRSAATKANPTAALVALSNSAFTSSASSLSGAGGAGRFVLGTKEPAEEPLTGDKGETTSEIAAMFGNW